ncbi:MAG TPA: MFS transporter [Polyangia bacterium]|nr:MFS transporter [Polyangia bacterium]
MPTATDAPTAPTASPASARALIAVVAAGIFVTGFGWPGLIGRLPFSLLLKNQLHLPADRVADFWAIATFAWYVKPLAGFICDAYPLLGTRRRGYLLVGSLVSGLFWLAFAFVPRQYGSFVLVMTALNIGMVFVSTVVGGLQIEAAQRYGATGRLASLRNGLEGVMSLLAGPVGGWLAVRTFGWTALGGALVVLSFVPVVLLLDREPRGARTNRQVWTMARSHLRVITKSRAMWGATGLLFLVYLAPGFQTPMLYYQQDVLKLDPRFMGFLQLLGGAGGIIGAALYAALCRRVPLRVSLVAGIIVNALSTLMYLRYDSPMQAAFIEAAAALVGTLATLPIYDLLARATPPGVESFAFSLMMSIRNVALFVISDPLGSRLYSRYHVGFKQLVWLNAGATAAVLLFVPLLPAALLAGREESSHG